MGYRPNQPTPRLPDPGRDPRPTSRMSLAQWGIVALAVGWSGGLVAGVLPDDLAAVMAAATGAALYLESRLRNDPVLPEPKAYARELQRTQIRAELEVDKKRLAWLVKTTALEQENGIAHDPAYDAEVAELTARMEARDALLEVMAKEEAAEAAAAEKAKQPPPPPPGRGAGSHGFIAPYARAWSSANACQYCGSGPHPYEGTHKYLPPAGFDHGGRRLPDPPSLFDRIEFDGNNAYISQEDVAEYRRVIAEHEAIKDAIGQGLLTTDQARELLDQRAKNEVVRRLTTAEPVRILGPGPTIRRMRTHICATADCNGIDSPHCRMSSPCTCMVPGRGWRKCEQHPELGPL